MPGPLASSRQPVCKVQKRQGVRLLGVGFCQVGENHRVLSILAQVSQWSGDCGSWLGRRVYREGREEKVGGCWQRERKQRRIVSSVQGGVCEILGCISSDWHMLGIGLPFSE